MYKSSFFFQSGRCENSLGSHGIFCTSFDVVLSMEAMYVASHSGVGDY
jgi:hypothetical protein